MSTDADRGGEESVKREVKIPESLEHAAKRVRHAGIESSEIAEQILKNTETETEEKKE